ncbi:MAG: hypothetical protein V4727_07795 [Verrucomicrobiota bacterium]
MKRVLNHALTAILLPAILGWGGAALSISVSEQYGWTLFLLLPVIVSFLSAFCWNYKREKSFSNTYGIACVSILVLGVFIIISAMDGLVCLLMAYPLTLALALIGAPIGRLVGSSLGGATGSTIASLLCLSFPFLVGFENSTKQEPVTRKVTTSVLIDASIQDVWGTVIAFPKITDPPTGMFRYGIAYPIEAHIDGTGVGAIRYCRFSTGDFVEPITVWDAPNKLAFDVSENPEPMRELSIYEDVHAPHLHGFMESEKGQFKLTQVGDQVRLEGSTWYKHSIAPEFYWGIISDEIIHKIHYRVLDHIKAHAEGMGSR